MIAYDYAVENYSVSPRIVPADRTGRVKIQPRGDHARFDRAESVTVDLYGVSGLDSAGKYSASPEKTLRWHLTADGAMELEAFFAGEQEYTLEIKLKNFGHPDGVRHDRVYRIELYSVKSDLYKKYPFRGDMHLHSEESDGELAPALLAARGRELGMDFLAVTDHKKYSPSLKAMQTFSQLPSGLLVCPGEEVQLPDTPVHIVNFGGSRSVNELAFDNIESYRSEVNDLIAQMHDLTAGNDPFPVGAAAWAFRKIRKCGGLGIFCHCFWQKQSYVVNEAVTYDIVRQREFDAIEAVSGHGTVSFASSNLQFAFMHEMNKSDVPLNMVGTSDTHMAYLDNEFGCNYTIVWAEELQQESIIEAIKNNYCAAAEEMTDMIPRFYGAFRMVRYAAFLRKHYFPQHDRLCAAEGILLREILNGNASLIPAAAAAAQAVNDFRRSLF